MSYECLVTECEVCDASKQVGLKKWPGLDGFLYKVYLKLSHMMDVFNHWFALGTIPGSIIKGMIILLKKGGRHVWGDFDDYRPVTLLNTELKFLAWVSGNRLQLVISDLIGPVQNYAVNGRSIQDYLNLEREIREGLKDGTEATLIKLDQSKVFDRVDHRFIGDCFGNRRIPTGVPQMN